MVSITWTGHPSFRPTSDPAQISSLCHVVQVANYDRVFSMKACLYTIEWHLKFPFFIDWWNSVKGETFLSIFLWWLKCFQVVKAIDFWASKCHEKTLKVLKIFSFVPASILILASNLLWYSAILWFSICSESSCIQIRKVSYFSCSGSALYRMMH